jgi:hypothetical protein
MANVKISQLPTASAPTGSDVVPLVQSGVTTKMPLSSFLSSPTLFGPGVATWLATPSSANLAAAVTGETGTGALVFATGPTLVTPNIGAANAISINRLTITAPATSATLTVANGKTLTASNSLTLAGTDATTMTFPTTSATVARTDAGQTFSGSQFISVNANSGLPASGLPGTTVLTLHGANASASRMMVASYGASVGLDFRRANGTGVAPTTIQLDNGLGSLSGSGYNGTAYSSVRASLDFTAAENWTASANGTLMRFTITPVGGTATTEVGRIESNGRLEMGNAVNLNGPALTTTAPADLYVRSGNTYVDNTTAASGTVSHGAVSSFGFKAIAATNATVTYTNASTIYVHGAPSAGANVTITNPWATYIAAGKSYLGDQVDGNVGFADSVGFRGLPQNSQSAAYTTVAADAGKSIVHPISDNNARTFTIDSNANVPYPVGTAITFINMINTVTIAITTDTMYLAGTGATGSRTLAAYGMATAVKVTSTSWIISGNGLT